MSFIAYPWSSVSSMVMFLFYKEKWWLLSRTLLSFTSPFTCQPLFFLRLSHQFLRYLFSIVHMLIVICSTCHLIFHTNYKLKIYKFCRIKLENMLKKCSYFSRDQGTYFDTMKNTLLKNLQWFERIFESLERNMFKDWDSLQPFMYLW